MAKRKDDFHEVLKTLRQSGAFKKVDTTIERVKTGIVGIDWLFGGGIPRGRLFEIFGAEASGKTTLLAEIAKVFLQQGEKVIFLDFEHAADLNYFNSIGVDVGSANFLYDKPNSLEDGIKSALQLIDTGEIGVLLVDSLVAMVPKAELDGSIAEAQVALQARQIGKALRLLVGRADRYGTAVGFSNQVRTNIGPMAKFAPNVVPGGRSLKFYATVRIEMKRVQRLAHSGKHRASLVKQKSHFLMRGTVEFPINEKGVDRIEDLKTVLVASGAVDKRSRYYYFGEKKIANSEEEFGQLVSRFAERFREIVYQRLQEKFEVTFEF